MTNTEATREAAPEITAIPDTIRRACALAMRTVTDDALEAISTKGAWRELNAKGNGSESYRRALSPGETWRFASRDRLPRGAFLAGDRKAMVRGDVFAGDLVCDFERTLRGGQSTSDAKSDYMIGLVTGPRVDGKVGADIQWMECKRVKGGAIKVTLPTGDVLTVADPEWRES